MRQTRDRHDVLSLSGHTEICLKKIFTCHLLVVKSLSEWNGICPSHVNVSFFFEWMMIHCNHQWVSWGPLNNSWLTLAVVTSATCTALPCRCDGRVPLETRGRNDSALHFILHFCIFLPHYRADLLWSLRGLKLLTGSLCVILTKNSKLKMANWLYSWLMLLYSHAISIWKLFEFIYNIVVRGQRRSGSHK